MSENASSNPQFVGQADVTRPTSEALPKEEVVLNAEQKLVVDVMGREGAKLETAELSAREKAAGQLKALQGKELVDAGLKQMGHGVWETVKKQAIWAAGGGLAGAIIGGIAGYAFDKTMSENAEGWVHLKSIAKDQLIKHTTNDDIISSKSIPTVAGVSAVIIGGAQIGEAVGFESAVLGYNKKTVDKEKLPPVKFYDWAASNVGLQALKYLVGGKNLGWAGTLGMVIANEAFNPISVAGMRNVATGLWQMRTPQRA